MTFDFIVGFCAGNASGVVIGALATLAVLLYLAHRAVTRAL